MQLLLNTVEEESRKKGLEVNSINTELMVVSRNKKCTQSNIFIDGNKLKQKGSIQILGYFNIK